MREPTQRGDALTPTLQLHLADAEVAMALNTLEALAEAEDEVLCE